MHLFIYLKTNQKGFTLLELLIAMAIGAIVMLAAYNVFISQQKSHKLQSELVDAEQNARAALDLLTREMRLAGAGVQRAILTADVAAGASTLTVVSSTGFVGGEIINIVTAGTTGTSEAVNLADAFNPADPYTTLTLNSTTPAVNTYTISTSDVSIFKEKITAATENSITFRAPITTKETVLYRGAAGGNSVLFVSNQTNTNFESQTGTTPIFIDDGGGKFENPSVAVNGGSANCTCTGCSNGDCDTLTLTGNLINSYSIGSKVNTGVDAITYAFDSVNDQITRNTQPFVENIDYFQIKYYDGSNNPIPNPAPSPYYGVTLTATERSKIRKVNIQIVAISSKDDTSHTETGTYEDGTTYANRGSTNRRRIFLESDILMANMAP
ncbi:MAG: prepilin-type N-terminal cleavage/methylation domain-containing protein [Nitrospirae bacterium]|nr:prepilin-type N-terminal cleavage/methylation domain-containing protein [Nitrospirota bacterium]